MLRGVSTESARLSAASPETAGRPLHPPAGRTRSAAWLGPSAGGAQSAAWLAALALFGSAICTARERVRETETERESESQRVKESEGETERQTVCCGTGGSRCIWLTRASLDAPAAATAAGEPSLAAITVQVASQTVLHGAGRARTESQRGRQRERQTDTQRERETRTVQGSMAAAQRPNLLKHAALSLYQSLHLRRHAAHHNVLRLWVARSASRLHEADVCDSRVCIHTERESERESQRERQRDAERERESERQRDREREGGTPA